MKKLLISILLLASLGACIQRPNPEIEELKEELKELKEEQRKQDKSFKEQPEPSKQEVIDNEAEKEKLTKIIEELNRKIDSVSKPKANPPIAARPSIGPGNANNTQGPYYGTLRVKTQSVNGKVNVRGYASTDSEIVTTLPNGFSNITYYDFEKNGDYVWYNVEIPKNAEQSYYGWIRGDFADRI